MKISVNSFLKSKYGAGRRMFLKNKGIFLLTSRETRVQGYMLEDEERESIVDQIIVVTPHGIAHILTADECLTFAQARIEKKGFSIRVIDNISRPIKADENVIKKIRQIENSVAREN